MDSAQRNVSNPEVACRRLKKRGGGGVVSHKWSLGCRKADLSVQGGGADTERCLMYIITLFPLHSLPSKASNYSGGTNSSEGYASLEQRHRHFSGLSLEFLPLLLWLNQSCHFQISKQTCSTAKWLTYRVNYASVYR